MADQTTNWWQQDADAPTGDDFLKTLPADRASMVRAVAEGRMKLPSLNRRNPAGAQLLSDVAQYDPSFDAANADARIAARKAFTSGKQGQNISSFNTALGHLGTLAQRAEDLNNGSIQLVNRIANAAEAAVGDPRRSNFEIAKTAVVDELTRAFRGSGGNVHDLEQWEANISNAQSPAQLRGAISQAAQLLQSRIQALGDSYNAAMGTTDQPLPLLNAHANDALNRFQSRDYLEKGYSAVGIPGGEGADNQPPVVVSHGGGGGGASPPSPPPGSPPLGPMDGPSSIPLAPASGKTHEEVNPAASAFLDKMIYSGANADQINSAVEQKFGKGTFAPVQQAEVQAAQDYLKAHPTYRGGFGRATRTVDSSLLQRAEGWTPTAIPLSAAAGATDAVSFGTLPKIASAISSVGERLGGDNRSISDIYNADLTNANSAVQGLSDAHPLAYLGGNVAGFLAGEGAIKKVGEKIAEKVPAASKIISRIPGTLKPLAADVAYGGAYGLGSSDSLADVPGNVVKGAVLSGAGGQLGRSTIKAVANVASPVANATVRRLTDAGITLTPGQILGASDARFMGIPVGKIAKGVEDRLAGFSGVGDVINSTRRAGVEDANLAILNSFLAKSGKKLPDGVKAGHLANEAAVQAAGDAYSDALAPLSLVPDDILEAQQGAIRDKVANLSAEKQKDFGAILREAVDPYLPKAAGEPLTGENLQAIKQGLDTEIARYRKSTVPADSKIADRLEEVRDSYLDLADRGAPADAEAYRNARATYQGIQRFVDAAAKTKDGIVSPNQYRQAVGKLGYGTTKRGLATGKAPGQDFATDLSTVLPSTVPDSGTPGRLALAAGAHLTGGALLGAGAGYESGIGPVEGALLGGALFSRPGAKAIQWTLAGSRGKKLNTLGDYLRRHNLAGGEIAAPLLLQNLPK